MSGVWTILMVLGFCAFIMVADRRGWIAIRRPAAVSLVDPRLLRAKALALIVIAVLTAALMAEVWTRPEDPPLIVPIGLGYVLFTFGYGVQAAKMGPYTKGTRIGAVALLLNILAMLLSDFEKVWFVLSAAAVIIALAAAYMLFVEARPARI